MTCLWIGPDNQTLNHLGIAFLGNGYLSPYFGNNSIFYYKPFQES